MSLAYGLKFTQQSPSANRPHILAFQTARTVEDDTLFELWNGPTSAAKKWAVDLDGVLAEGTVPWANVDPAGSSIDDIADVTITTAASGHVLQYDGANWANVAGLATGILTSGTLGVTRGGTGVSDPTTGNLLVGAGSSAMTALAPGADGGLVRSNGSAWVRSTLVAGDIPSIAASKITSGEFDAARIPSLDTSKLTTGTGSVTRGFTGVSNPTTGNLLVGAGSSAMTALAPSTDGGFVRSNGTAWVRGTIAAGDIPSLAASKITSGEFDAARIPSLDASKITAGTLVSSRGGTGVSAPTSGNLLVGAGSSAMTALAPSSDGGFVRSNGSAWVRSTIAVGDLPSHTHAASQITAGTFGAGDYTISGGLTLFSSSKCLVLSSAATSGNLASMPSTGGGIAYVADEGAIYFRNSGGWSRLAVG